MNNNSEQLVSNVLKASELVKDNPELISNRKKYKNVPVVYFRSKNADKVPIPGLSHFIKNASSVEEVNSLLKNGIETYKTVSNKTVKMWKKTAEKRISELNK